MPFTLFYRFVCWKQLRNRIPSSWIVISFFFISFAIKKSHISEYHHRSRRKLSIDCQKTPPRAVARWSSNPNQRSSFRLGGGRQHRTPSLQLASKQSINFFIFFIFYRFPTNGQPIITTRGLSFPTATVVLPLSVLRARERSLSCGIRNCNQQTTITFRFGSLHHTVAHR